MLRLSLILIATTFSGIAILFGTQRNQNEFFVQPLNQGGAAPGMTGAPGESNCTQCHSGAVQNGTTENVLVISQGGNPVNSYTPGQQYNVNLSMASNPVKRGFQATALNSSNLMAGSFTGVSSNTSINGGAKKYANHTSSSNTAANAASWNWTWTAPAAGTGNVTFYVATNKTNNNNNDNGDMIYLSQHTITEASNAIEEESSNHGFLLLSTKPNHWVIKLYNADQSVKNIEIVDGLGKRVFMQSLANQKGDKSIELPVPALNSGIYFISFSSSHGRMQKKINIQ